MQWIAQNAQGGTLTGAVSGVPPAADLTRAQHVIVLVPSENVLLLELPALAGSRSQVIKAVPYALEDRLAESVEDMHFALPERQDHREQLPVAAVAEETLRGWIQRLADDGIRADAVYAETQVLPYAEATGCILIEDERAIWRFGQSHAGACELNGLRDWIDVFGASESGQPEFEVFDFRDAPAIDLPAAQYHAHQRDALVFLSAGLKPAPEINLLQGAFAPSHRQAPVRQLWRRAAIVAAAAVVLAFAYQLVDYWRLSHRSIRLETMARSTLHSVFPKLDKVPGDPRQLLQSQLTAMHDNGNSTGLLHLLPEIAPVLGSTTRMTLTGIEYHNATLELALNAPDVPTLDLMRERLSNLPGLKAQVTAANSGNNGIDGRLRITGAGR